jgi:8-oxo-dGTP diphosphatase
MKKKTRPQCGLLIENKEGKVLLQLRDNIDSIPWPGCWGTFGGQVEEGETAREAMKREIWEELHYSIPEPEYYGNYPYDGYDIFMYRLVIPDITLDDVTVCEGQAAAFLSLEETVARPCAANCREIIIDYYRLFHQK